MSIEPPRTSQGIPGPIILLGFLSILLIAAMAIFGMLAFDVSLPGMGDDDPGPPPAQALEASGFAVLSSDVAEDASVVEVEFTVTNTADETIEGMQVLVQCDDGGYVSAIRDVPPLEGGEGEMLRLALNGMGEPACAEPDVSFSPAREGD